MHKLPVPRPSRASYVKHRQDVMLQVILPVALAIVVILAVAILISAAAFKGGSALSTWAAIATIWIILPVMVLLLLLTILFWTLVWLLARLLKISPRYTGVAQEYALMFNEQVVLWTNRIMQPILQIKAWLGFITGEK